MGQAQSKQRAAIRRDQFQTFAAGDRQGFEQVEHLGICDSQISMGLPHMAQ